MQTNVHVSIYRPFPHPSCLVQHLQFVNYKLNAAETHLKVQRTINHSPSPPPHKILLHKSLSNRNYHLRSQTSMLSTSNREIDTQRNNALPVKNKINYHNVNSESVRSGDDDRQNLRIRKVQNQNSIKAENDNQIKMQQVERRENNKQNEKRRELMRREQQREENRKNSKQLKKQKLRSKELELLLEKQRQKSMREKEYQKQLKQKQKVKADRQNKIRSQLQKQNTKLNDLVLRIRKQHTQQIQSLRKQLQKYQIEVQNIRQSKIRTNDSKLKNQELNAALSEQLQQIRSLYRTEKQRSNLQRKQIHHFKKKVFELESANIDLNREVEQLKQVIQVQRSINSQLEIKNQQLEEYLQNTLIELEEIKLDYADYRNNLKPLHLNAINACEVLVNMSNLLERLKSSQIPSSLLAGKYEIASIKEEVVHTLDQLQSIYQEKANISWKSNKKLQSKEAEKSVNDSYKYLKTCADDDTVNYGDSSLYHMILCQATALEENY